MISSYINQLLIIAADSIRRFHITVSCFLLLIFSALLRETKRLN